MERDAPSPPIDQLLPPPEPRMVYKTGLIGAGLCAAGAILGLGLDLNGVEPGGPLATVRLLLVAAGLLAAGGAITLRAGLPGAWLIGSAAAFLSWFTIPPHWDSARLVAGVMAAVALAAAVLAALPKPARLGILSIAIMYHFSGIFCATTWPDPTPWATQQVGTRVYLPYLWFMYLRNAYHFYSPDPGPSSILYCLIKYELDEQATDKKTGKPLFDEDGKPVKKPEWEWVVVPDRGEHLKDPLAVTYYRRLSITDQVSHALPDQVTPSMYEKMDVYVRRRQVASGDLANYPRIPIPPDEFEPGNRQYQVPMPGTSRYLLPSYARHLLISNSRPGREAVTVKIYRLEHRVLPVAAFAKTEFRPEGYSPYHPITYRPYYLGEYYLNADTGRGELLNPQDPMLYWLVPVLPKVVPAGKPGEPTKVEDEIDDYLSKHAGFEVKWRRP